MEPLLCHPLIVSAPTQLQMGHERGLFKVVRNAYLLLELFPNAYLYDLV